MNMRIAPSALHGTLTLPGSKSAAHRALICAALAGGGLVRNITFCEDVQATLGALEAVGAQFRRDGKDIAVLCGPKAGGKATVPCGESGSTLRFLIPILAALGGEYTLTGQGRLLERPNDALFHAFEGKGLHIEATKEAILLEGKLGSGTYALDAGISSQYVSGLLFALPLLGADALIDIVGEQVSRPYVDMTLDALRAFGVNAQREGSRWVAEGRYTPAESFVEGDWSAASFFLAMGAMRGEVVLYGLKKDSLQGDRAAVDLLRSMGADIAWREDGGLCARGGSLHGIDMDVRDVPDLVPPLAVAACAAQGSTTIRGAQRLRTKESDRLAVMQELLASLGGRISEVPDGLDIVGGALAGGAVCAWNDHRIAMAAATASCLCAGDILLTGAGCVAKSYPDFWLDFASLGGAAQEV